MDDEEITTLIVRCVALLAAAHDDEIGDALQRATRYEAWIRREPQTAKP
jgi:hypothetical protein